MVFVQKMECSWELFPGPNLPSKERIYNENPTLQPRLQAVLMLALCLNK